MWVVLASLTKLVWVSAWVVVVCVCFCVCVCVCVCVRACVDYAGGCIMSHLCSEPLHVCVCRLRGWMYHEAPLQQAPSRHWDKLLNFTLFSLPLSLYLSLSLSLISLSRVGLGWRQCVLGPALCHHTHTHTCHDTHTPLSNNLTFCVYTCKKVYMYILCIEWGPRSRWNTSRWKWVRSDLDR